MEKVNEYVLMVFKMMIKLNNNGYIRKIRPVEICKQDRKVLNKIFTIYKIYNYQISKRIFRKMVVIHSIISKDNFIISGMKVADRLEKIMKVNG